jgi:hypothetical protein
MLYSEALAARLAASLAVSLNLRDFSLEGDSITVILALQDLSQILDWKIADLISDSVSIIPSSSIWKVRKVHRSANFCAHHVAYWAAANVHSGCIPTYFSPSPSFPICSGKDPPSFWFELWLYFCFVLLMKFYLQKKKKILYSMYINFMDISINIHKHIHVRVQ